ncbi:Methionyl-tRNA synthetase [Aspergillus stella-maris]|uniref:Methionyl-tRNA synthetase n=1 Tax=Aspergillus stella-maris TaxID=1810926 RepID=UPI003CCD0927
MTEEPTKPPILPISGQRNILITSTLPYVNNVPHLGNLIGSVLSADVFARFCRARGINTLYVCVGQQEQTNGTTTETRALQEGISPKELCDKYHAIHWDIYKWFNISFDVFGRTTTQLQTSITHDIILKLLENGYLDEQITMQLFCPESQHTSFLADRFVEGVCPHCAYDSARGDQCDGCGKLLDPLELASPRCKLDGVTPEKRETNYIFLALDKLQPQIKDFVARSSTDGAWSKNGEDITNSWLRGGLKPRSITRDMKWGTPVPSASSLRGYEDKVIYAWFDACIGYISITATYTPEWERCLIGTGEEWTKLHHLSTTDYLTYEGGKFSKSREVGVFGDSAKKTGVPSDVWRYYLLSRRPENGDAEFNWESFISANNNILLKNLGNLVSRVIKFVNSKHCKGVVPDCTEYKDEDALVKGWKDQFNGLLVGYTAELDAVKLRAGLATALAKSQKGNAFLQSLNLSNKLAETEPIKCAAVVGFAVNLLHLLVAMVEPFMPKTAGSICSMLKMESLGIPDDWSADSIKPGHAEKAEEWRRLFGGQG